MIAIIKNLFKKQMNSGITFYYAKIDHNAINRLG